MRVLTVGARAWVMMAAVVVVGLGLGVSPARADDCSGMSIVAVRPESSPGVTLDVRFSAGIWQARVAPIGATDNPWRTLVGVPAHAHVIVVGPSPDGVFAVIRAGGERDRESRVLFYNGLAGGFLQPWLLKPARRLDLKDLLTEAELTTVSTSISHIRWLDGDKPVSSLRVGPEGLAFVLRVSGGREVPLSYPAEPLK